VGAPGDGHEDEGAIVRFEGIGVSAAYDAAAAGLKEFRDAHMAIVTLYIIGPAARARRAQDEKERKGREPLKGTGGTNLVQFLKGVRNQTKNALLPC
jgi:indoleamine 2,3-dioxygenase